MKTLRKSPKKDQDVIILQNKLNCAKAKVHGDGEWLCLTPDGIFGNRTEEAVKAFQKYSVITRDGVVGPQTWAKLEEVCSYRHFTDPALCDFNINTNSILFMLSITNDPKEDLTQKDLTEGQEAILDNINKSYNQMTTQPSVRDWMTFSNYAYGTAGSAFSIFGAKYWKYNELWHLTKTRGVAFAFQSRWYNFGAIYQRSKDIKALANARGVSGKLPIVGSALIGADILMSGEIKTSHGINALMLGISYTGWGALIAAGWIVIDMSVGGYNKLVHGKWESLSDIIDNRTDMKIEVDDVLTRYDKYQKQELKNGFWGLSKI